MVRAFRSTETVSCPAGDFTLAIDIGIIDELEDEFDLSFDELMGQFKGKPRVGKLARLLRGLLARHHPDLTLDDVGALVLEHAELFGTGLEQLFTKARPDEPEAKAANPPKRRRGTGASS